MADPVLLGPFRVHGEIASGGMGTVYRAATERGVPVAIKVLGAHWSEDPAHVASFRDEVRAVAALDHPGIVMLLDHGVVGDAAEVASNGALRAHCPWLAMELASGGTLKEVAPGLGWRGIKSVLLAVLDGLAHAHARGVVHRDIKPGNVLIATRDDLRPGLKLTDFGIAQLARHAEDARPDAMVAGTPHYMPPEQVMASWRDYGPWSDLYAVGCLAWWLVCGQPPFQGKKGASLILAHISDPPGAFEPRVPVPAGVEQWVRDLLHKDRWARYQLAPDAAVALLDIGDDEVPVLAATREADAAIEEVTRVALGETWRLGLQRPSVTPTPIPRLPNRLEPAPVPSSWERPIPPTAPLELVSAGMHLFGLRPIRLVGRETERTALWTALTEVAHTGTARAVVLRGPAGTGKSRLALWLCERAREVGAANVSRASFSPLSAPGEGIRRMGEAYVRSQGLSRPEVEERARMFLEAHGCDDEAEIQTLAEILSPTTLADINAGGTQVMRLTRPSEWYSATRNAMRRVAAERPLVTWLDDVQWGVHGLGLARQVLRTQDVAPFPVLLVLTVRDEDLEGRADEAEGLARLLALRGVREIRVGPLPRQAHRELVRDLLRLDPALAARVEERTSGNPLFAVQLVGDWVQRRLLEVGAHGLALKEGAASRLPDSLHEVWTSRIQEVLSEFPDTAGRYLEVAAVLGVEVLAGEWHQACDDPQGLFGDRFPGDRSLRRSLVERLIEARLAVGNHEQWSFVHPMLRESLERGAAEAGRHRDHHLACAAMLWARAPSRETAPAERLGLHLLAAGQAGQAIDPLLGGVEQRLIGAGPELALSLLAVCEEAMVAAAVVDSDKRWGKLWTYYGRVHRELGDLPRAVQTDRRTLAAARLHGWRGVERYALLGLARSRLAMGDLDAASDQLGTLYQASMAAASPRHAGLALRGLAEVDWLRADVRSGGAALEGDLAGVASRLEQAATLFGLARDPVELAQTVDRQAACAEARGRVAEARSLFEQALSHHEQVGVGRGAARCSDALGRLDLAAGAVDDAGRRFRRALSRYEALGAEEALGVRLRLAVVRALQGEVREARRLVRGVRAVAARSAGPALSRAFDLVNYAVDGVWVQVDAWLASPPTAAEHGDDVAWCAWIAAVAARRAGEVHRADALSHAARAHWTSGGRAAWAAEVDRVLAASAQRLATAP